MKILHLADEGGACGDEFDNSSVLLRLLESLRDSGGGKLVVGKGLWRTGPIELYTQTELTLDEGAVLSFIPDTERYAPVLTRWEGIECHTMRPCIFSSGQHDVSITGKGRVDGNGKAWWDLFREKRARGQKVPELDIEKKLASLNPGYRTQSGGGGGREIQFLRPSFVQFANCKNVRLEGITVSNSPFWTVHPLYCEGVIISGVTIENPHDAPNTDGIDIDSCCDVEITHCTIGVGDDGIVLKSGSGADGIRVNKPTKGVTVRNCTVGNGHGGIVIGSETAAGVSDVLAENCDFLGTDRGIRIKTRRGRGGVISGLVFRNLNMEDNLCPLAINMYYRCGLNPGDEVLFSQEAMSVSAVTPHISGITVSGIRAIGCRASAGFVAGLPESPIENLVIEDCTFATNENATASPDESDMYLGIPPVTGKGFRVLNAINPVFRNVTVTGPAEPFIMS